MSFNNVEGSHTTQLTESSVDETDEIFEILSSAAQKFNFKIPFAGSPALKRLFDGCLLYARMVDYVALSPRAKVDVEVQKKGEDQRRQAHRLLCTLLIGKSYEECSYEQKNKVSNFAMDVAGKNEFIDTFN